MAPAAAAVGATSAVVGAVMSQAPTPAPEDENCEQQQVSGGGVVEGVIVGVRDPAGDTLVLALRLGETLGDGAKLIEDETERLTLGLTLGDGEVEGLPAGDTDGDRDGVGVRDAGGEGSRVLDALSDVKLDGATVAVVVVDGVGSGVACVHWKLMFSIGVYSVWVMPLAAHGSGGGCVV